MLGLQLPARDSRQTAPLKERAASVRSARLVVVPLQCAFARPSFRVAASSTSGGGGAAATSAASPLPTTRPAALAALGRLLAVADDAAAPPAQVDAAEAQAIALARRLAGLGDDDGASTSSGEEGEGPPAPPSPATTTAPLLLRGFGRARQVPKRAFTLADLRLNKIEPAQLLSPVDATLDGVRSRLRAGALAAAALALALARPHSPTPVIAAGTAAAFAWGADAVGTGGALSALALDAAGRALSPTYARRVAMHEAGHFLVAYLVGLLPRGYTLSSAGALVAEVRARGLGAALAGLTRPAAQAGTRVCDGAFRAEVAGGRLRGRTVDAAVCVALAGVCAEYLTYGTAEGGLDDVRQLDGLCRALGFSQAKADSQIRWAVLNACALLRRHAGAHAALAGAMERGDGVAACVGVVEDALAGMTDPEI